MSSLLMAVGVALMVPRPRFRPGLDLPTVGYVLREAYPPVAMDKSFMRIVK